MDYKNVILDFLFEPDYKQLYMVDLNIILDFLEFDDSCMWQPLPELCIPW